MSDNINDINEVISDLINNKINVKESQSIKNLKTTENKTSLQNILIFLLKYSFKFETSEQLKEQLNKSFNKMYPLSNQTRKIEKYYNSNIQDENLKIFLDKVNYIISFVLLCLSPGEIIEYEYIESHENKNNFSILEEEYNSKFNNLKESIFNKDIFYYNNKILLNDENNEFSKYEKQVNDNDINFEEEIEEEEDNKEFSNLVYSEIENK